MSTPTKIAEHLESAADLLDEHGWCRLSFVNTDGAYCTISALKAIEGDATAALNALLYDPKFEATHDVVWWNDHVAKDKREVTSTMRRVARKLRGATR